MFIYNLNEIYNPNPATAEKDSTSEYPLIIYLGYKKENFPVELENLLKNILKALKLNFEEVLVIYEDNQIKNRIRNIKKINSTRVVSFGVLPKKMGLNVSPELYKIISFSDIKLIIADDISELNKDSSLKLKLWNQLQILFELK